MLEKRNFSANKLCSYLALNNRGFVIGFSSKTLVYSSDEFPSFSIPEYARSLKIANLMSCDVLVDKRKGNSSTGSGNLASSENGARRGK